VRGHGTRCTRCGGREIIESGASTHPAARRVGTLIFVPCPACSPSVLEPCAACGGTGAAIRTFTGPVSYKYRCPGCGGDGYRVDAELVAALREVRAARRAGEGA
jgi:hypothetical protein